MSTQQSARRAWSLHEDTVLLKLIDLHGSSGSCWSQINVLMKFRTGKQCRERYINHLDPSMKKSAWTAEENNVIRDMFPEYGTRWSQYMIFLPGRSDHAIKNHYHIIQRNNFESCRRADSLSRKRCLSETSSEASDDDIEIRSPQNRLRALQVAHIKLNGEILELEGKLLEEEYSYLTNSEIFTQFSEEPLGELEMETEFNLDWTDLSSL
eukprot:gene20257-23015_t